MDCELRASMLVYDISDVQNSCTLSLEFMAVQKC